MGTGGGPRQPANNSDVTQEDVEDVLGNTQAKQAFLQNLNIDALAGVEAADITDPEVEQSGENGVDYNINLSINGVDLGDLDANDQEDLRNAVALFYAQALGIDATRFTVTLDAGSIKVNVKVINKITFDEQQEEEAGGDEGAGGDEEPPTEKFQINYVEDGGNGPFAGAGTAVEFTQERKTLFEQAITKWNRIITTLPGGDDTRKITLTAASVDLGGGLGRASFLGSSTENFTNNYYKQYTTSGSIEMNSTSPIETEQQQRQYEETAFHEIGHVLGIGTFWLDVNNDPDTNRLKAATGDMQTAGNTTELILTQINGEDIITTDTGDDNNVQKQQYLYRGTSALEVYRFYNAEGDTYKKTVNGVVIDTKYSNNEFDQSGSYFGIPMEDGRDADGDGQDDLQIGGHLLEGGDADRQDGEGCCISNTVSVIEQPDTITSDGPKTPITYGSLNNEIMSGGAGTAKEPISAITLGLVEDLGYGVDWTKCEEYRLNQ